MSRQLTDRFKRIFDNALVEIEKGKTRKALENLTKVDKLSEKAKLPDYQCQALMLKGRALLADA